ncbi:hypothetical protein HMPREF9440_01066 [Sutterella parvirubra YIT 11816]|uniref:Uncharacterized protein n=1 Tax=Sutterella parvirubra YIT 11816 TaxID=762967 RepID=H3KEA2_9BURK|nr:hypothetical protein HMPREF9440_01066 [Sutterella parvirubra YIT 11816]
MTVGPGDFGRAPDESDPKNKTSLSQRVRQARFLGASPDDRQQPDEDGAFGGRKADRKWGRS